MANLLKRAIIQTAFPDALWTDARKAHIRKVQRHELRAEDQYSQFLHEEGTFYAANLDKEPNTKVVFVASDSHSRLRRETRDNRIATAKLGASIASGVGGYVVGSIGLMIANPILGPILAAGGFGALLGALPGMSKVDDVTNYVSSDLLVGLHAFDIPRGILH